MNSQRSAPLSRSTAERSAFQDVAPSRSVSRATEIELARGGTGGLSVSSGEPPAHAAVGAIPLPGTRSGRIAGSEVRANRNVEARAIFALRGREPIFRITFQEVKKGDRIHQCHPAAVSGKGGVPRRPHTMIRISERNAPRQWRVVNFLASDPKFWSRPPAGSAPSGPGVRGPEWNIFATPVTGS